MEQTKLGSLIETIINTAIGFVVSYAAWPVAAWLFKMYYSAGQHMAITIFFTVISVARGYIIRRWFNARLHRASVAMAAKINKGYL